MVSEVQYDIENDPRFRNNPNDPLSHLPIRKMIALYDYDPQELSPNFDTEVSSFEFFFCLLNFSSIIVCVCVCCVCSFLIYNCAIFFLK